QVTNPASRLITDAAFIPHPTKPKTWFANIYQLARIRLQDEGIRHIYTGDYCTYTQADQFFSFRRDNKTGRQATCIWIEG
ncbi:MAG: laccase domain-containing protein, partial [Lactobacillus panisapium]